MLQTQLFFKYIPFTGFYSEQILSNDKILRNWENVLSVSRYIKMEIK